MQKPLWCFFDAEYMTVSFFLLFFVFYLYLYWRPYKTSGALSEFIERLKEKGKSFNVIAVAIANKLARIAYACLVKNRNYQLV